MDSYVDSVLVAGEQVIHRGQISWLSMIPAFVLGGLMLLFGLLIPFLFLIGMIWIITSVVRRLTTELAVTNKRVVAKTGLISRNTIEMNLTKVESVRVNQSILGRMLDYGSIVVNGTGGDTAPVPYVADPMGFKRAVTNATDAAQQQGR
jgi:uncharacterized membrane protein YdbT with pleckstrin-like domain